MLTVMTSSICQTILLSNLTFVNKKKKIKGNIKRPLVGQSFTNHFNPLNRAPLAIYATLMNSQGSLCYKKKKSSKYVQNFIQCGISVRGTQQLLSTDLGGEFHKANI